MSVPKVLVGVVTYEGKDYCWDLFFKNLLNLEYPNYDVLIVDNSKNGKYYRELQKRTKKHKNITIARVDRGLSSREAQANSLNYIRNHMLDNDYDYFMSIESDLVPPVDIIERLMSHKKQVIGSIYLIGFPDSQSQPPRPCLFNVRKDKHGKVETFNLPPNVGFTFYGKGVMKVHGCGLGATLIKRDVLEKIKFWYIHDDVIKHSDVLFYMDLHNIQIQCHVDTDMIIPHYNSKWSDVKDA